MSNQTAVQELRDRFRSLHDNMFVMPNPWDVGSARILEALGYRALATTSSGMAAAMGRQDQQTTLGELEAHVASITAAVSIPLNVDAEFCFSRSAQGVAETVDRLAAAGASGISIEDYDPVEQAILDPETATERVAIAVNSARQYGVTLTARSENHLYGVDDLDDTIARLVAYKQAGADVLYAPGIVRPTQIVQVVEACERPVNVLALPGCPSIRDLDALGVRRVSTGGALAWAAYGALARAGRSLFGEGTYGYLDEAIGSADREAAFGH